MAGTVLTLLGINSEVRHLLVVLQQAAEVAHGICHEWKHCIQNPSFSPSEAPLAPSLVWLHGRGRTWASLRLKAIVDSGWRICMEWLCNRKLNPCYGKRAEKTWKASMAPLRLKPLGSLGARGLKESLRRGRGSQVASLSLAERDSSTRQSRRGPVTRKGRASGYKSLPQERGTQTAEASGSLLVD